LKKNIPLFFLIILLAGCTTYKFQKASPKTGYLATYNDEPVIEYTVGKDKALPQDLSLAKERFKRRKETVEYYYKKMGLIESRFREAFLDPPSMAIDFIGGVLRWPFTAVSDYRYNHNPKYKERMDRLDEQNELLEQARVSGLKEKLAAYIAQDLTKEPVSIIPLVQDAPVKETASVTKEVPLTAAESQLTQETLAPVQKVEPIKLPVVAPITTPQVGKENIEVPAMPQAETTQVINEPLVEKKELAAPVAVITANPVKGLSPLTVKFSGAKSSSKNGKIVSYHWDFGDADSSEKKNPQNTYWSTTYGSRKFTVTLTVKDQAGASSSASSIIEVINP